jgi:hypothetical protein
LCDSGSEERTRGCPPLIRDAGVNWIAEGTETSLTAARVFDMLVCSAVNSTRLAKWQPPDSEGEVVVFGDADPAFEGQAAAYALANCLAATIREKHLKACDKGCILKALTGSDSATLQQLFFAPYCCISTEHLSDPNNR